MCLRLGRYTDVVLEGPRGVLVELVYVTSDDLSGPGRVLHGAERFAQAITEITGITVLPKSVPADQCHCFW